MRLVKAVMSRRNESESSLPRSLGRTVTTLITTSMIIDTGIFAIIGIATESGRGGKASEDAIYLDARERTEEMEAQAIRDQQELGILTSPVIVSYNVDRLARLEEDSRAGSYSCSRNCRAAAPQGGALNSVSWDHGKISIAKATLRR